MVYNFNILSIVDSQLLDSQKKFLFAKNTEHKQLIIVFANHPSFP